MLKEKIKLSLKVFSFISNVIDHEKVWAFPGLPVHVTSYFF